MLCCALLMYSGGWCCGPGKLLWMVFRVLLPVQRCNAHRFTTPFIALCLQAVPQYSVAAAAAMAAKQAKLVPSESGARTAAGQHACTAGKQRASVLSELVAAWRSREREQPWLVTRNVWGYKAWAPYGSVSPCVGSEHGQGTGAVPLHQLALCSCHAHVHACPVAACSGCMHACTCPHACRWLPEACGHVQPDPRLCHLSPRRGRCPRR